MPRILIQNLASSIKTAWIALSRIVRPSYTPSVTNLLTSEPTAANGIFGKKLLLIGGLGSLAVGVILINLAAGPYRIAKTVIVTPNGAKLPRCLRDLSEIHAMS
jgi:hypothetical protein